MALPISCEAFRSELAAPGDAVSTAHALECAACAAFARKLTRNASALRALERLRVPAALDVRAETALEAGFRAERAIGAVSGLGRQSVPSSLDDAVARAAGDSRGFGRQAPEVLRRLVEEELADPTKAIARRHVGSMRRMPAPEALELAVRAELSAPRRARPLQPYVVAAGLLLAGALALTGWALRRSAPEGQGERSRIVWVQVDRADQLSPLGRSLLAGYSGGALEASRLTPTQEGLPSSRSAEEAR